MPAQAGYYSEDLELARACARGEAAALEAFEARFAPDLRAVHARGRGDKPPFDEFAQAIRAKLFVGPSPRIAEYRGAGALGGWLRVVATRVLIEHGRRAKPTEPYEDSGDRAIASSAADPETEYLKRRHAADVHRAFEDAARRLDAESRELLREHYARGMGIDAIAAAHDIHRATAARRLAAARDAVLRETRKLLMARLGVSRDELESIARMVESRMHVTVERVFG